MKTILAFLLHVFLRPLTLGLAYETLRVWFPALPAIPWLDLWGIVVLVGLAKGGTVGLAETDPERVDQLATQMIGVTLVRLATVLVVWAVVT